MGTIGNDMVKLKIIKLMLGREKVIGFRGYTPLLELLILTQSSEQKDQPIKYFLFEVFF